MVDFGNTPEPYTGAQRLAYLEKLLPRAYLISAKGMSFDADYRHTSYDFEACVATSEKAGFSGIYSIELWTPRNPPADPFAAVNALKQVILRAL